MRAPNSGRIVAVLAAVVLSAGCRGAGDTTDADVDKPPPVAPPAKNTPPVIEGSPVTEVSAGSEYLFEPRGSDPDGDVLRYDISGRPAWAQFDSSTGRLTGRPASSDEGLHENIEIAVSDGKASSALPRFSIKVAKAVTKTPPIDKDADFAARVAVSKAWYAKNFGQYATLEDALRDHGTLPRGDATDGGRLGLNTDPRFALSGGKSLRNTMTPTEGQGGQFRVDFHKWAPPGPQKDGNSVREFYVQYALYWTREALTWTHRDAQTMESVKTLLLEAYGGGQLQPGMRRRMGVVTLEVNGSGGCERKVTDKRLGNLYFHQSALDDPTVTITDNSKLEDHIAKHGFAMSMLKDSAWGYVAPRVDWRYKGRWETGGDWTRNLIDHPDRGHPYGGWGWPELKTPPGHTPWTVDGWTTVEIYVKQDPTVIGYTPDGKPQYNPQTFRVWAAPYGEAPRLIFDSLNSNCVLAYNSNYYQRFSLLFYDTQIVSYGGHGAKVDARTFQPTTTQFEVIYEPVADDQPYPFRANYSTRDKTTGVDHEFMGNRIGWNTGALTGQLTTIVDSQFIGMVQDGVDAKGEPVMKRKTRLTVEPMPLPPVGGTGNETGFDTTGNYLQVQTWVEEGYRPPLSIYYDELLMSYEPIPFPGHLDAPLPNR